MKSLSAASLFFYKQWYDAGVKTLPDILDKEGKFLAFTVFQEKYQINSNFLCYIALCNAIPKHWRKSLDVIKKTIW